VIKLPFCPQCGKDVPPDKKFCTQCGAPLQPPVTPESSGTADTGPGPSRTLPPKGIIAGAAIVVAIIAFAAFGYPVLTSSGIFGAAGSVSGFSGPGTPAATPAAASYVEVITLNTPPGTIPPLTTTIPATMPPVTTATTKPINTEEPEYLICSSDMAPCNNTCTNFRTSISNCGSCGHACAAGQFCLNGNCVQNCTAGQTSCMDGCYNLATDPKHCGTCTNSCPKGLLCEDSTCRAPATPMLVPV